MKKIIFVAAMSTLSTMAFSASESSVHKLATSELKSMDCATLSVEKADAKRALETADKNLAAIQTQTPGKTISKWAGVASGALTAFGGNSEKAAKANQIASNLAGTPDDASNAELQQQNKTTAQTNVDNISVYQKSKKCKI